MDCLQEPQGGMGVEVSASFGAPITNSFLILTPGKLAEV